MKFFLATLSALVSLAGGSAFANVISYQHTTTTATAPFSDNFSLPAFNLSLGTLTAIEIKLSSSASAEVDVYNSKSSAQPFTNATATVPVTVLGPAGVTTTHNLVAGPVTRTAPVGFSSYPGLTATGFSSVLVPTGDFSQYEASSPGLSLTFTASVGNGTYSGTAITGVFFSGSADVGGTTTITYTYVTPLNAGTPPVPEPTSVILLGTALVGLGLTRRRSR